MKTTASISLLVLLLFNCIGYRLVTHYADQHHTRQLEARIDQQHFDEADLLEISVPLDLPYHADWQDFERFDGEVEVDGVHYKYVKRRVYQGKLILLCLPNTARMHIQTARDQFFRLINDLNHSSENGSSGVKISKAPVSDYLNDTRPWALQQPAAIAPFKTGYILPYYRYSYHSIPAQPPDNFS